MIFSYGNDNNMKNKKIVMTSIIASVLAVSILMFLPPTSEAQNQITTNDPTQIDGIMPVNDGNVPIPESLTNDDESKILTIIQNDAMISDILSKGTWNVVFLSPVYNDGIKTGGAAHIVFEKSIWFEGIYDNPPTRQKHTAKLWLSAMDVFVDFNTNNVVGIDPGVGKPSGNLPKSVENIEATNNAKAKAMNTLQREDLTTKLLAIYQTPEYPDGIAFYMIDSVEGNELSIGVNLTDKQVVDKYTTVVLKEQ